MKNIKEYLERLSSIAYHFTDIQLCVFGIKHNIIIKKL
jgi:hypothetical protein